MHAAAIKRTRPSERSFATFDAGPPLARPTTFRATYATQSRQSPTVKASLAKSAWTSGVSHDLNAYTRAYVSTTPPNGSLQISHVVACVVPSAASPSRLALTATQFDRQCACTSPAVPSTISVDGNEMDDWQVWSQFGPGDIEQAHTKDEWIDLEQLERAAEIYYQFALKFQA